MGCLLLPALSTINLTRTVETGCFGVTPAVFAGRRHAESFRRSSISGERYQLERCHGLAGACFPDDLGNCRGGEDREPVKLDPARRDSICAQCHQRVCQVAAFARNARPTGQRTVIGPLRLLCLVRRPVSPASVNSHFESSGRVSVSERAETACGVAPAMIRTPSRSLPNEPASIGRAAGIVTSRRLARRLRRVAAKLTTTASPATCPRARSGIRSTRYTRTIPSRGGRGHRQACRVQRCR
jgi:hypothetical protein